MCFACGKDNPIGLHIEFDVTDGVCTAEFTPNENHLSWEDTVHGGIIYSALDDVTGNIPYAQGLIAHTARCEIRYRQALEVGQTINLIGWIESKRRRLIVLKGEARLADGGTLVADCEASFMVA